MPFISVLVPSMRAGGVDILLDSLAAQEFTDFELVFVDALHSRRAEKIAEEARNRFLRAVHIPSPEGFPVAQYCAQMNAGLVHCTGEVVLLAVDFTRFPPGLLRAHAEFHKSHGAHEGLMAPHRYVRLDVNPKFPRYDRGDIDKYADEVRRGILDEFMWSIGEPTDVNGDQFVVDGGTVAGYDADPKLRMQAGPVEPAFLHCKNESVRLERILEINGFDEALDGSHGWQDSDIADRLSVVAGVKWTLDPSCVADIANPRNVFPFAKRLRDFRTNEGLWWGNRERGYPTPNTYSLRERRAAEAVPGMVSSKPPTVSAARRLRIAMIYGEFSTAIHPPFVVDDLYVKTGLTGSESSFFNLARSLSERGHEVAVFCVTEKPADFHGAAVLPMGALIALRRAEGFDAVIAWNEPNYLEFAPPGALRVVDQQLNDFGYCNGWRSQIENWAYSNANWRELVDLMVSPSQHHLDYLAKSEGLSMPSAVIPNSVDLEMFKGAGLVRSRPRDFHRVIWASSPDRGLHHVLSMWPEIRRRVEDAELHVFYRLEPWLAGARDNPDEVGRRARYIENALVRLAAHGVVVRGPVANADMAREFQGAGVLAYPCDPVRYTEGFGCSVLDACAGGCLPVISDADALPSVHSSAAGVISGRPGQSRDAWINILTWALLEYPNTKEYGETQAKMRAHAEAHSREKVAEMWERLLVERIK